MKHTAGCNVATVSDSSTCASPHIHSNITDTYTHTRAHVPSSWLSAQTSDSCEVIPAAAMVATRCRAEGKLFTGKNVSRSLPRPCASSHPIGWRPWCHSVDFPIKHCTPTLLRHRLRRTQSRRGRRTQTFFGKANPLGLLSVCAEDWTRCPSPAWRGESQDCFLGRRGRLFFLSLILFIYFLI